MPTTKHKKLADALERAVNAAPKGVLKSAVLQRADRELLRQGGYLKDIVKGWYFDGNGRLARFLMNLFLASAGHPWTIVRTERRSAYMAALERASTGGDIEPFARFILGEMQVDWQKEK